MSSSNIGIGINVPLEKLHVNGGILIGNSVQPMANNGTIRWNGTDFQGRKNGNWISLTGIDLRGEFGSIGPRGERGYFGGDSNWSKNDDDQLYNMNTVSIGIEGTTTDGKLYVKTNNISDQSLKIYGKSSFEGNVIVTGTLSKTGLLSGNDLLEQIENNKNNIPNNNADIITEKSRIDAILELSHEDLNTFKEIVNAYKAMDISIGITGEALQNGKQDKGVMKEHLIPDNNGPIALYDIGSADFKIRHLFVSNNSFWIGNTHKISINSDGTMKFRKVKLDKIPIAFRNDISNSKIEDPTKRFAPNKQNFDIGNNEIVVLNNMTLKDWVKLGKDRGLKLKDIFADDDDDYHENVSLSDKQDIITSTTQWQGVIIPITDTLAKVVKINEQEPDSSGNLVVNYVGEIFTESGKISSYDGGLKLDNCNENAPEGTIRYQNQKLELNIGENNWEILLLQSHLSVYTPKTKPEGYSISAFTLDQNNATFIMDGVVIGTTLKYKIKDSDDNTNTNIDDSLIVASTTETKSGIDISNLKEGTLTLEVTLTLSGNDVSGIGDTKSKVVEYLKNVPSNYTIELTITGLDASIKITNPIVNCIAIYKLNSDGGGKEITGSKLISSVDSYTFSDIVLTTLHNGTITATVTLTNELGNIGSIATDTKEKNFSPTSMLYDFRTHTFTNCGAIGKIGPTYEQCINTYGIMYSEGLYTRYSFSHLQSDIGDRNTTTLMYIGNTYTQEVDDIIYMNNRIITILKGKGAGQSRTISDINIASYVMTVTIDPPWDQGLIPDSTSHYTIDMSTIVGTAQSNNISTNIKLSNKDINENDDYNDMTITITEGTGSGQSRTITDYVKSTKTATINPSWTTDQIPDSTSVYKINVSGYPYGPSFNTIIFNTSDGSQKWKIPCDGLYTIEVYGAQGGSYNEFDGGKGAKMVGTFYLKKDGWLGIMVGQKGTSNGDGGGGGGGTCVVDSSYPAEHPAIHKVLIIAGGGGGGSDTVAGQSGNITTDGNDALLFAGESGYPTDAGPSLTFVTSNLTTTAYLTETLVALGGEHGGVGGFGGRNGGGGGGAWGGGGGGLLAQGGKTSHSDSYGHMLYILQPKGGVGKLGGFGGYGGGGGGGDKSGGGGGGYSGGGGGTFVNNVRGSAGGGGSYNIGFNQTNKEGYNSGNGKVIITLANNKYSYSWS